MKIHHTNHPLRLEQQNILEYLGPPHAGETNNEVLANLYDILKITHAKNLLEIGFNRGKSCLGWLLANENLYVTSIDIIYNPKSVSTLNLLFGDRFEFIQMNSGELLNNEKFKNRYDLIFVDGQHSEAWFTADLYSSLSLNPDFIVFDDYFHPAHHNDFIRVIGQNPRIRPLKEYGTDQGMLLAFVLPE